MADEAPPTYTCPCSPWRRFKHKPGAAHARSATHAAWADMVWRQEERAEVASAAFEAKSRAITEGRWCALCKQEFPGAEALESHAADPAHERNVRIAWFAAMRTMPASDIEAHLDTITKPQLAALFHELVQDVDGAASTQCYERCYLEMSHWFGDLYADSGYY